MEEIQSESSESIVAMANDKKRTHDEENNANASVQSGKKQKTDGDEQIIGNKIDKSAAVSIIMGSKSDNENKGNDDEEDEPLHLDDINNDCLRHIFEFLSVHELIKVAQSTSRFVFAAAEAFSRRYRKMRFEVMITEKLCCQWFRFGYLQLNGAMAVAGLQHFGARMSTLSANFAAYRLIAPAQRYPIDVTILKKCQNSLQTLEIHFCIESHFDMIEKPFEKVENLVVNGCKLGVKFAQLNKWFPNLVNLKLSDVKFVQPIQTLHFEHLTTLHIVNDEDTKIQEHTIHQMLRLNRELKSLKLRCDYRAELLLAIKHNLVALETLELWIPTDLFASYKDEQKISLATLKTLILHAKSEGVVVEHMPFVLKNVDHLRLYGFHQYHPLIVELIASADQLKTVYLYPFEKQQWASPNEYEAFKQVLLTRHHLNELEFCVDEFIGDDLLRFIEQCKHVNVLRLLTTSLTNFQSLQIQNDDWLMPDSRVKIQFIDLDIHNSGAHFQMFYQLVLERNK